MTTSPESFAAAATSAASAAVDVNRFSQSTRFPAATPPPAPPPPPPPFGRERLLAEHVLSRRDRPQRPRRVQRVRQRIVDRVDDGIGYQRRIGAVHHGTAGLGRELPGAAGIAGGHGGDRHLGDMAGWLDQGGGGDPRGAERPDPQPVHHRPPKTVPAILCRQSCTGNPVPSLDERPYSA